MMRKSAERAFRRRFFETSGWAARLSAASLAVLCLGGTLPPPTISTIQEESCIEPDIEYPVPCDED